jgi:hypothetical protein
MRTSFTWVLCGWLVSQPGDARQDRCCSSLASAGCDPQDTRPFGMPAVSASTQSGCAARLRQAASQC